MKSFPRELAHGSGAIMSLDPAKLLLSFRQPSDPKTVATSIRELDLVLEEDSRDPRRRETINHTAQRYWTRTIDNTALSDERYHAIIERLGAMLEWAGPVYRFPNSPGRGAYLAPLPDVVLVKPAFAPSVERPVRLDQQLRKLGLREVKEKSAYLSGFRYFKLENPLQVNAFKILPQLLGDRSLTAEAHYENMPMIVPLAAVPDDPLYPQEWAMTQVQAGGAGVTGWDLGTGAGVTIAIIDTGVDVGHPDLNIPNQGIRLDTMMPTGAPASGGSNIGHGTCCAGLAAGRFDNNLGVAGVAGNAAILPIAFVNWTDAECAAAINWAVANGAQIVSMSFGVYAPGDGFSPTGWNFAIIDPAITNAVDVSGAVLLAATGNENTGVINRYPARNARVIAVGGSDQADNRKNPASPDGENWWGANFGPGISVVAPCVLNPTTDIQGNAGYNGAAGVAGDYFMTFNGTSSATPITAGFAAVLRGAYPALTNLQIREFIERTADKVGGAYADVAGFPNGTRNNQMGYGRINMLRGTDQADVFIRDYPADTGVEPSSPPSGNFWSFSDVVVRITDDNVFNPGNPAQSSNVERGQTNYIYAQVTNRGPREARNVTVNLRLTPYVGVEFVHPADWTAVDAMHVSPAVVTNTFAALAPGASAMAKFTVSAADVEALWGWQNSNPWHPCLLVSVNADNDYAFAAAITGASPQVRRNNIAQRNLTVIDVLATASVTFPFVAGNVLDRTTRMDLLVNRAQLPRAMRVVLSLDEDGAAFPRVNFDLKPGKDETRKDCGTLFLERTRIETKLGCCRGVLTLEAGSRFDCQEPRGPGKVSVKGGEIFIRDGKRFVEIRDDITVVQVEKSAGAMYPLALRTAIPANAPRGAEFHLSVSQRTVEGEVVGGAAAVYRVK
jgi:subtilisin family serine protease